MGGRTLVGIFVIFSTISSSILNQSQNKTHLRLAVFRTMVDRLTLEPDGNCTISGPYYELLKWLSRKLDFTYTLVPIVQELLTDSEKKMGMNEVAFSKVQNKEIDGLFTGFVETIDRRAKMDFTFFVSLDPNSLFVPVSQPESRLFAFVRPFRLMVWIMLLVSLIFMVCLMSSFSMIYRHLEMERTISREQSKLQHWINNINFYIMYVANIMTNHAINIPLTRNSFRILIGGWLLAATVLVNSYSSTVVSSLTLPKMKPAVNSFEDLAANKEIFLLLREDNVLGQTILNAKSGILKTLGDQVRQNKEDQLFFDFPTEKILKKVETGRYAFPYAKIMNVFLVATQFKKEGKCRFQVSDSLSISSAYYSLVLQKDSKYTPEFSTSLMQLWETGLNEVWKNQDLPKADQCFAKKVKPSATIRPARIKLEDLTSAFLILGIGLSLAIFCFLVETIAGFRNRRQVSSVTSTNQERLNNPTANHTSLLSESVVQLCTCHALPLLLESKKKLSDHDNELGHIETQNEI